MAMADERIEIEFKANTADFRRALLWQQWKRLVLIAVLWPPITFLLLYYAIPGGGPVLIALVVLLMLPLLLGFSVYTGILRPATKLESVGETLRISFDRSGIETITPTASSRRQWDGFKRVVETKEDLIFLPYAHVFFSVPLRYFAGDAQIQWLRSLLREMLGDRAELRS